MATMHIPKGSGWLPHPDVMKKWLQHQIDNIPNDDTPFHDVIIEFKNLIETTPEIYMGFDLMFEQTKKQYDEDPTHGKQVCDIFPRIPSPDE